MINSIPNGCTVNTRPKPIFPTAVPAEPQAVPRRTNWHSGWAMILCFWLIAAEYAPGATAESETVYFSKSGDGRGYFLAVSPDRSTVTRLARTPSVTRLPYSPSDLTRPFPSLHLNCRAGPLGGGSERNQAHPITEYVQLRPWPEDPSALNVANPIDWPTIVLRSLFGLRDLKPYFLARGVLTIKRGTAVRTVAAQIRRESFAWSSNTRYIIPLEGTDVTEVMLPGRGKFLRLTLHAGDTFKMEAQYRMGHYLQDIITEMAKRCPA